MQSPIKAMDGHWLIPDRPGLGVEVSEATVAQHPFKQEIMHAGNAVLADGTFVEW